MKMNCWLVLGAMIATSAIAQNNTNTLPEMPAPVSTPAAEAAATPAAAPEAKTPEAKAATPAKHPKRAVVRRALKEPTVTLVPGPAEVAVSNLIVRGQAGLKGDILGHLFKGDAVTVLGQINLDKHATGEPAQWAKIALPSSVHVWVHNKYIDAANKVVSAKKLNLRSGPGENFNVLGVIEKGTPVNELETKGAWTKIEPPTNAYAFIAAMYLKQEAAAPVVAATAPAEPTPAPTPTPVPETQPIVTEPANPPPAAAVTAPAVDNNVPPPPRVASHEGVVRHVGSVITPTEYELYDPTTDKNIDFLYTTSTNLNFGHYVGMRIIATGEEGLAKRWNDIPVLTVDKITVLDPNAVPQRIYRSPRQSQAH